MKNSLKIILLYCFMFTRESMCATIKEYEAFANQWIATYVKSSSGQMRITPAELNVLLNLAYFSYMRSVSTLASQDVALQALTMNWQLLQNITHTRRNPSIQIPHPLELKKYGKMMKQAWKLQQEHECMGQTYANMLEFILKKNPDTSDQLREGIERLREQARVALVDSLSAVKEYIQTLIAACQKNVAENESNVPVIQKRIAIIDYLLEMLPQLAATSFVVTDRISIQASEEGWNVLAEIQRIHNLIWAAIEQRRANFYAIIYHELYSCALEANTDDAVFQLSFDCQGLIETGDRIASLPDSSEILLL